MTITLKTSSEHSRHTDKKNIRVALADDHPIVRHGINSILSYDSSIEVVGEAIDGYEAQKLCENQAPDVLLLDLSMPGPKLTELITGIKEASKKTKILVLSAHDDDIYVREVIKVGVEGYLLKEEAPDVVTKAIHAVHKGSTWFSQAIVDKLVQWQFGTKFDVDLIKFTKREREVLGLVAKGLDNEKIATILGLAEQTIRNYIGIIYEKIDVHTRAEAVVWAIKSGFGDEYISS